MIRNTCRICIVAITPDIGVGLSLSAREKVVTIVAFYVLFLKNGNKLDCHVETKRHYSHRRAISIKIKTFIKVIF